MDAPQNAPLPTGQQPSNPVAPPQVPMSVVGQQFVFQTGQHYKVHHSYIWLSSLIAVGAFAVIGSLSNLQGIIEAGFMLGEYGLGILALFGVGLLMLLVVYGLIVGVSALTYKNLSYVFDEKEFSLYQGIFTKRHVHVPYTRVQSVNHRQSLIQRLAGVCSVEIDTAGGASNKAIKVPYVKLDVGEAIRAELFLRKAISLAGEQAAATPAAFGVPGVAVPNVPGVQAGPVPAGVAGVGAYATPENILDEAASGLGVDDFRGLYGGNFTGMEPVSFERKLANKELLLASISHSGVTGAATTMLVLLLGFGGSLVAFLPELSFIGLFAVPLFVIGFIFLIALSMGTVALSYGSFSVRRRGSRIEVERGILQRDFSGIDVNRVQSVVVRQSFVRRLLGYCEVSLGRIRAGGGEDQNTQANLNVGGLVVHPFLKIDQVDGLLAGLLPEFADRPTSQDFKGLPAIALRRGLLRRCIWRNSMFWMVLLVVVCQVVLNALVGSFGNLEADDAAIIGAINLVFVVFYVLFVLGLVFTVLGTLWWKRGSGFAISRRYVALCNDGLSTETIYLPRQKIQDVFTRTNPFQRAAHVATIGATTAAGVGGTRNILWDVTEEDALLWLRNLTPQNNVVE